MHDNELVIQRASRKQSDGGMPSHDQFEYPDAYWNGAVALGPIAVCGKCPQMKRI